MSIRDDLDDRSQLILKALYHLEGQADTSAIKDYTGIEDNSIIRYRRVEYLEPMGLVETEVVDSGDTLTVTEWTLTEKGTEVVGSIIDSADEQTLVEQVEELREVVADVRRRVETFDGRLNHTEEQFEEIQETLLEADEAVTRAVEASEKAEAVTDQFEDVLERNKALQNRIRKMEEVERVMKEIGFVRNDAIGGWENDEEGGLLKGPLLLKLEALHDAGAIDHLGNELIQDPKRFGPFGDDE